MVYYNRARHGPDLSERTHVLARFSKRRPNCVAARNFSVETSCVGECYAEENNNTGGHLARRRVVAVHGAHALRATYYFIGYRRARVRGTIFTTEDAARPEDGSCGCVCVYGPNDDRRLLFSFI